MRPYLKGLVSADFDMALYPFSRSKGPIGVGYFDTNRHSYKRMNKGVLTINRHLKRSENENGR